MRNRFLLYTMLCVGLCFTWVGCDTGKVVETQNLNLSTEALQQRDKLDLTAKLVVKLTEKPEILKEIHYGVSQKFDGDDNVLFKDLLDGGQFAYKAQPFSLFSEEFRKIVSQNQIANKTSDETELLAWLDQNLIQIYWPYSSNWDGKEAPVLTFDPGSEDADFKLKGYRVNKLPDGKTDLQEVEVDEAYAKQHPVWVINKNEHGSEKVTQYRREVTNPNAEIKLLYKNLTDQDPKAVKKGFKNQSMTSDVKPAAIGWVQLTQQYDPWWKGGSELVVVIIEGGVNKTIASNISEIAMVPNTSVIALGTIERDRVGSYYWVHLYKSLDLDWKSTEEKNLFGLYEGVVHFLVEIRFLSGS